MKHRPGITLVEVLVSIFIMGIGMIALLTLFPLGALNVAQALRDDRASQCATNANAFANAMDLRHDTNVVSNFTNQLTPLANRGLGYDPNGPSAPIYVDAYYGPSPGINAGSLGGVLTRVTPSYVTTTSGIDAWFSLLDDLTFSTTGLPTTNGAAAPNTTVERTGAYNWAYLLRRPRLGNASVTDMTVVVYAGRVTQTTDGETLLTNAANQVSGAIGSNSITFNYNPATKPRIRNGSWIMDVTQDTYTYNNTNYTIPRCYFYRVVNAVENAGNTSFTLELQNTLKAGTLCPTAVPTNSIVVMEKVIEVFDRGDGFIP